jgi:hypothetical protein
MELNKKSYRIAISLQDNTSVQQICVAYDLEIEYAIRKYEFYEIARSSYSQDYSKSNLLECPLPLDIKLVKHSAKLADPEVIETHLKEKIQGISSFIIDAPNTLSDNKNSRFEQLQQPWLDKRHAIDYYGIELDKLSNNKHMLAWSASTYRSTPFFDNRGNMHRYLFEIYMHSFKLLPVKFAAVRLGMDVGIPTTDPFIVSGQFVRSEFVKDFSRYFPSLTYEIFSNHDEYCALLHSSIKKDTGIVTKKLKCITSQHIKEKQPLFAYSFDILTCMPVSIRYSVPLSFGKPMSLEPDVCSAHFFYEHRYLLRNFLVAGYEPDVIEYIAQRYKAMEAK